jgi:acetolactate synthase-like protein
MSLEPADKYLNPLRVLLDVEKILPDNAILVADGGDFVGTAAYVLR